MRSVLLHSIVAVLTAAVLGLLAAAPAAAEERVLVLDPDKTQVTFTLGALLHTVEGSFELRSGEIRFDTETGFATGRVEIEASSGETGNHRRDRRMHREVLESDRYPLFVLTPTSVEGGLGVAGGGILLRGDLEAYGGRHPVEITTFVESAGDGRVHATGGFTVPYAAWGMKDVSNLLLRVSEAVEVRIETTGELSTPEPMRADAGTEPEPPPTAPPTAPKATPAKDTPGDDGG